MTRVDPRCPEVASGAQHARRQRGGEICGEPVRWRVASLCVTKRSRAISADLESSRLISSHLASGGRADRRRLEEAAVNVATAHASAVRLRPDRAARVALPAGHADSGAAPHRVPNLGESRVSSGHLVCSRIISGVAASRLAAPSAAAPVRSSRDACVTKTRK